MLNNIITGMRAWLAPLRPCYRRALRKRALETACRANGCSRAQATAIAAEFLK